MKKQKTFSFPLVLAGFLLLLGICSSNAQKICGIRFMENNESKVITTEKGGIFSEETIWVKDQTEKLQRSFHTEK